MLAISSAFSSGARERGSQAQPGSLGAKPPTIWRAREPGTDSPESSDNLESLGPKEILSSLKSLMGRRHEALADEIQKDLFQL